MVNSQSFIDRLTLSKNLGLDDLSWTILTLILLSLFIYAFINSEQSSIVHPIILGRQSDFSPIRKQSETPIITNSGACHGMFPVTPDRTIKSLDNLLSKSEGKLQQIDLRSTIPPNHSFKSLIANARNNIWALLSNSNKTNQSPMTPQLMIICADPYLKLVISLAAATLPVVALLVTPNQSGTLPVQVKRKLEPFLDHLHLIISEIPKDLVKELLEPHLSAQILDTNDISAWFESNETLDTPNLDEPTELHNAKRLLVVHNFSNSDEQQQTNDARIFEFTPANLLAGITASLSLFSPTGKPVPTDTFALEFCGDETIWGFQISLAAAALYSGATVYFFRGFKLLPECQATVLVTTPMTAQILAEEVIQLTKLSLIKKLAIGFRLSKISNGMLASRLSETTEWVGPKLRAILTNGPVSCSCANLIRAAFGVGFQRIYTHPVAAGPILASHPYDFQVLQRLSTPMPCGPPSVNVECKILGVSEPSLINHDVWKGKLAVRGPSVGAELKEDTDERQAPKSLADQAPITQNFYDLGEIAQVVTNGTFRIFSPSSLGDD